jgi:opacity protein-like surface antigen
MLLDTQTHNAGRTARFVVILTSLVTSIAAQELPRKEVIAHAGVIAGNGGGNGVLGGTLAYPLKPRLAFTGEMSYIPGGSASGTFGNEVIKGSGHGVELAGGVRYLFPWKHPRLTPYGLGGLGILRASGNVTGNAFRVSASATELGLTFGGGLRYQAGNNWGIQPELRFFVAGSSYTRLGVGVYYQFGE